MGNNLAGITDLTRLVQDVQYTAALKGMTAQDKQKYFESQKSELLSTVLDDRQSTFQKTLTDATRTSAVQNSLMFYNQRNRDLDDLGKVFLGQNNAQIGTEKYNNHLATRQYEINEWSYNNKLDTLFVFQILFITLILTSIFVYLHKAGFYNSALLGIFAGVLLFIDIVVIVYRARYTSLTRNQRYWNKKQFSNYNSPTGPSISACPSTPAALNTLSNSQPGNVNDATMINK